MQLQPKLESRAQSKVLKWSLIIAIVIVLNLFFNYTLSLVYKQPSYDTFCPAVYQPTPYNSIETKEQFNCQNNFDAAQKVYDRNVFISLVILGALCVAVGSFLKKNILISIALSLGGVLSFIIASMRYWSSADNLIKVIILAIALLILVWVAIKKFKDPDSRA